MVFSLNNKHLLSLFVFVVLVAGSYVKAMEGNKKALNKKLADAIHLSDEASVDVVRAALEQGADPNYIDEGYKQPVLIVAIEDSTPNPAIIKLLLQKGADPLTKRYGLGSHAFIQAVSTGKPAIVQAFLSGLSEEGRKQVVGILDQERSSTALQHIAGRGFEPHALEIAKILIEAGADPSIRDMFENTPSQLAAMDGYDELATYLATQERLQAAQQDTSIFGMLRRLVISN